MVAAKRKDPPTDGWPPEAASKRWLCFVRHAQALHNVFNENLWTPDNPLTQDGEQQCQKSREEWGVNIFKEADLVVVSPMTRALQTAYFISGKGATPDDKFLVTPMCSEHLSGATCDEGRPLDELKKNLPWMNSWSGVDGLQENWWKEERPEEPLRASAFLEFLQARPEQKIVVVSHGAFLGQIVGYHMPNASHHMMSVEDSRGVTKSLQRSTFNINFAIVREYEESSLKVLAKAPVTCLQGLGPRKASLLASIHGGPKTVTDLANWKFARWAESICILSSTEQDGSRDFSQTKQKMNINKALDKDWEGWAMSTLLEAPISAFAGIPESKDPVFKSLGLKCIKDLGEWKYFRWARAICNLAEVESEEGHHS